MGNFETPKKRRLHSFDSTSPQNDNSSLAINSSPEANSFETSGLTQHILFDFSKQCIFCKKSLDKFRKKVTSFGKNSDKKKLIEDIKKNQSEETSKKIIERLEIATTEGHEFYYHATCYAKSKKVKSPINKSRKEEVEVYFENLFYHIETSGEFKFNYETLKKNLEPHACDIRTMFDKLEERFGDNIYIGREVGKSPYLIYRTSNFVQMCNRWFFDQKSLDQTEKKTILNIAANILKEEIKSKEYLTDSYPSPSKFLENVESDIPPLLNYFLDETLETSKRNDRDRKNVYHSKLTLVEKIKDRNAKHQMIAHSMISLLRPNSFISTLQLAIGTYVYRKTSSSLVIDLLSKIGVSVSYYHLRLFEASAIMHPPEMKLLPEVLVQFVFDNTDHNVKTLNGRKTFHCLGGIAIYYPEFAVHFEGDILKLDKMPTASELAAQKQIPDVILENYDSDEALKNIKFIDITKENNRTFEFFPPAYAAAVWGKFFNIPKLPTWKGLMEKVYEDVTYSMSHINCLPFINAPPSDLQTLNTALHYAADATRKNGQKTCFVTFDQPLYYKARLITSQSINLSNVVVRLGGFHLLMSYLGSIGYIMSGSGLEDLWATIYAEDSIKKMMTGHAFARAVRAHILSFTALGMTICEIIDDKKDLSNYKADLNNILSSNNSTETVNVADINSGESVKSLTLLFSEKLEEFAKKNGKTAKLWVQYFKCVSVALRFIEAERIGNWKLHLQSVQEMLPLFYAAGHFAYAKCAQIYLQDMLNLDVKMAENHAEYVTFTTEGGFTVRRTDKAWSGVWSDMTIEQTLNRFFGTDLKHGRGCTSSVIARYLLPMPTVFGVMQALENHCGIETISSEQHVDSSKSKMKTDDEDITKLLFWLKQHKPFENRDFLISLSTGIIGNKNIDCHMAVEKGLSGMSAMVGKTALEITMHRQYRVTPLSAANSTTDFHKELSAINPMLLFQRISLVINGKKNLIREALEYELSPFPLSIFDQNGVMRTSKKSDLYKIFEKTIRTETLPSDCYYVVDGGWLLRKYVWPHTKTYQEIFEGYRKYVVKKYGTNITVVFDGYNKEIIGTKSYERFRRKNKSFAADVEVLDRNIVTHTQTEFLKNVGNKYKLVQALSEYFNCHNINNKIADEDADALIVTTAIEKKNVYTTVAIVGTDVDLFILSIALTPLDENIYFLKVATNNKTDVLYSTRDNKKMHPYALFAHSFVGCDTTSAFFGIGKNTIWKILGSEQSLQKSIEAFNEPNQNIDALDNIAKHIIKRLYGDSNSSTSITDLRYKLFQSTVSNNCKNKMLKPFNLENLPPTESALREHVKRVYFQIQAWLGNNMIAENWGWRRTETMLMPVMTEKPAAPEQLLNEVHCNCKTNCSKRTCTCKKAGIKCSELCKNCNGETCENSAERDNASMEDEFDNGTNELDFNESNENEINDVSDINLII